MMKDGKKVKDDYLKDGKRQFERHSGTGKQAFGNKHSGGFGKGN